MIIISGRNSDKVRRNTEQVSNDFWHRDRKREKATERQNEWMNACRHLLARGGDTRAIAVRRYATPNMTALRHHRIHHVAMSYSMSAIIDFRTAIEFKCHLNGRTQDQINKCGGGLCSENLWAQERPNDRVLFNICQFLYTVVHIFD